MPVLTAAGRSAFPASLIIVGAYHLVFISLYGMRLYAVLAGALAALGTITLFLLPNSGVSAAGWEPVFLVFAVLLYRARESHSRRMSAQRSVRGRIGGGNQ